MKVLFLSVTSGLFNEEKIGGWIASLESIFHLYLSNRAELGLVFETKEKGLSKLFKNGTTYYPVYVHMNLIQKIVSYSDVNKRWELIKPYILHVINDFNPDIIHCFGSEWPYAAIVECIDIPLVVHMQGFLNIINLSKDLAVSSFDKYRDNILKPKQILRVLTSKTNNRSCNMFEKEVMRVNHYFMGRTDWDRNIVKYYSPGAKYYCIPEAIRPVIYNTSKKWKYHRNKKITLFSITKTGYINGNEIVLRTAQILKDLLGVDFEWRIAGREEAFPLFEKKTGISASNVSINLLGMIDAIEIVDELVKADLYIHTAIIDNSPNSLCEAQLVGCPVIAANVGGIPQLVEDGKTGFLYPYNEPHTLAFKICNLIDNAELLTRISQAEIEMSRRRHDPQNIADSVFRTYEAIINDYKERFAKP